MLFRSALPQYKLAVAKSKYSTLKNITKSLKESVDRYYLVNSALPTKFSDLDVDLSIQSERDGTNSFYIYFPGVDNFEVYHVPENLNVICSKTIMGKNMRHTIPAYPVIHRICTTYSINTSDITNKVCQQETNKTLEQGYCGSGSCSYYY